MAEILIHQTISQQPRLESLTMTVPGECVGRIIGRQGDTIRYSMKQDKVTPRKYVCKIVGHIVDVCKYTNLFTLCQLYYVFTRTSVGQKK